MAMLAELFAAIPGTSAACVAAGWRLLQVGRISVAELPGGSMEAGGGKAALFSSD